MAETTALPFKRVDLRQIKELQSAERPPLRIRWWFVLPLALFLCAAQAWLNLQFEFGARPVYLIATQISIIAFSFLFVLTMVVNPLIGIWWPHSLLILAAGIQGTLFLIVPLLSHDADLLLGGPAAYLSTFQVIAAILAAGALGRLSFSRERRRWSACAAGALGIMVQAALILFARPAGLTAAHPWLTAAGADLLLAGLAAAPVLLLRVRWAQWTALLLFLSAQAPIFGLAARGSLWVLYLTQGLLAALILFVMLVKVASERPDSFRALIQPFNRGEVMALFAALFVSAGISSFGLVDQLIPMMSMPFDPQFSTPTRGWSTTFVPYLNKSLFITDPQVIEQFRQGLAPSESSGIVSLVRHIPWAAWVKPVALWMIFVFAIYLMFYSLTMLLFDAWAKREKLVFPLARLPEDMISDASQPPGSLPATLKNGLFWLGFGVVFLILSYNAAAQAAWIPGMAPLRLGIGQEQLKRLLANSALNGIADGGHHSLIFMFTFTAWGVAYLLPLEISASVWRYHLLGLGMILVAIWTAAGASSESFPSDYLWENNFVSSLGAGGLLAFALAALVKLVLDRVEQIKMERHPRSAWTWATSLAASFGWGGLLFLVTFAVSLLWLRWAHVSTAWAAAFLAIVILVTVSVMRLVAEGGIYWIQVHTGPFHLAKLLGSSTAVPGAVLGPLMPIYSILFLDIQTYMAPAALNSFKMQEETRAARRWFHTVVAASIIVTVGAAVFFLLCNAYKVGARHGSVWFFNQGPCATLDAAKRLVAGDTGAAGQYNGILYLAGAGWVALSLFMRRRFFWWLHPIGFVMLANPLTAQLWFSFFLGWLCKKLAVQYGGRHMFARLRPLFVGLIFGELAACFAWMSVASILQLEKITLDIHRHLP